MKMQKAESDIWKVPPGVAPVALSASGSAEHEFGRCSYPWIHFDMTFEAHERATVEADHPASSWSSTQRSPVRYG